jgi:hypothetical protein
LGQRYGISIQSGRKDGAPSPSSTIDRAISVPPDAGNERQKSETHRRDGNDDQNGEPARQANLQAMVLLFEPV